MTPAQYAVIQYIADPGRNEALNVGILLWSTQSYRLRIDESAVARVVRENPLLERDALLYLEPTLRRQLLGAAPFSEERLRQSLEKQKGFPARLTEPRFTTLAGEEADALDSTLDRLIDRIVRPRRRVGRSRPSPVEIFERRLRPLIRQGLVYPNYFFESSQTGIRRVVDFYANKGADVALDTLVLDIKRADSIRTRADAEAFKIEDIRTVSPIEFIVYCDFSASDQLIEVNQNARRAIESTGAKVITDIDEAAQVLESVAKNR